VLFQVKERAKDIDSVLNKIETVAGRGFARANRK
jgi:hypothetical protein